MKANPTLIAALRTVADRIEAGSSGYYWGHSESCNCGLLARELANRSGADPIASKTWASFGGHWTSKVRMIRRAFDAGCREGKCPITGTSVSKMWSILEQHGLEWDDYSQIEFLKSGLVDIGHEPFVDKTDPVQVVKYFRALADKLEKELPVTVPTPVLPVETTMFGAPAPVQQPQTIQQPI